MRFIPPFATVAIALLVTPPAAHTAEKLRAAYPAVAPGSTPSWITAEKKIWQKYGLEVEPYSSAAERALCRRCSARAFSFCSARIPA